MLLSVTLGCFLHLCGSLFYFLVSSKCIKCPQNFEFRVQLRDQVLTPTGVESGYETGVAGGIASAVSEVIVACLRRDTFSLSTLSHPQAA